MHRIIEPSPDLPKRPFRFAGLLPWLLVAYLATSIYTVQTSERAVVRRFGKALPELQGPGLKIGLPYGFDRVSRLKIQEPKRVAVATSLADRALGRLAEPLLAECLTGDRNLIQIPAIVQYRIEDPKAYLFRATDVPALVRCSTSSAITSVISSMNVDDVLTTQRRAIRARTIAAAQHKLDEYGVGVRVTAVSLEGISPPEEVADAFRDVNNARWDRDRAIEEADGYRRRVLPLAEGEARRTIYEAEAYREEVLARARGDAQRFKDMAAELAGDRRELTQRRLILETMERVLPRLNKIILGADANAVDLGLFEEKP